MKIRERAEALAPGSIEKDWIHVGHLASGAPVALPYMIVRGKEPYPVLWVNATVHGNESQATISAIEFYRSLQPEALDGTVVVTPVANTIAFDTRTKNSPFDGLDLDQSFPSRATGLTTERIAGRLFAEIEAYADVVVNLHTVNPSFDAAVYGVYKSAERYGVEEMSLLRLLALFDPFVACRMSLGGEGELPGNIGGALDYQVLSLGKRAFMVEVGASGAWNEVMVQQVVSGLWRLAGAVGVMPAAEGQAARGRITRVTKRSHITCSEAGLFRQLASPGTQLEAGQPLGEICNVHGDRVEVIRFEEPVLIIGVRADPVVHTGDRVAFVGQAWDEIAVDAGAAVGNG